ncbi:alpha/beta fold hydrolase [Actinomadura scrupuli]|uniref:alpha/beta fold hydrolase n=1 Tax=Actinomadura scrupuli TaxID=559629 RepID=UPI003D97B7DE
MDSRRRRRIGIVGAAAGLGAAGLGAAVGIRKFAVGRVRLRPDPDAAEPFGSLRGRPLTVLADDGLPLHVEIEGADDAPLTVVFSHGYCLNQDSWHYQRRDLGTDATGLRMVFWDQRSHGRSGHSKPTHATIDQTGADLHAVLKATVRQGEPVVLVGHSMGGMTIMALADQHPELFGDPQVVPGSRGEGVRVTGVVMANTSSGELSEMTLGLPLILAKVVLPLAPGVIRSLSRRAEFVDRTRQAGADLAFIMIRRMGFADKHVSPTMVDFVEQMIRGTTIDVIAEFYPTLMGHDKIKALEVLGRVPAVVLTGGADRLTPAAHGRAIAEAIRDTELVEVAEAGHLLPLEYPGIVTAAIRRLIGRAGSAATERPA